METSLRWGGATLLVGALLVASGCIDAVVGDVCTYGGKGRALGERFPTSDGCNTCTCEVDGEVSCTLIGCGDGGTSGGQAGACTTAGGRIFQPGQRFTSDDGCNECTCLAGGAACTERACEPGAGTCVYNGVTYPVGASFSDGCNTCSCSSAGAISCTDVACPGSGGPGCTMGSASFPVGARVPCPDGCNQCTCESSGWAQTLIGCTLPKIERCDNNPGTLETARILYLKGSALAVEATIPGCANEGQRFKLCYDGAFAESYPVQTFLYVVPTSTPSCSAMPTGSRVFDISPLADLYKQSYQTQSGSISVHVERGGSVVFDF